MGSHKYKMSTLKNMFYEENSYRGPSAGIYVAHQGYKPIFTCWIWLNNLFKTSGIPRWFKHELLSRTRRSPVLVDVSDIKPLRWGRHLHITGQNIAACLSYHMIGDSNFQILHRPPECCVATKVNRMHSWFFRFNCAQNETFLSWATFSSVTCQDIEFPRSILYGRWVPHSVWNKINRA